MQGLRSIVRPEYAGLGQADLEQLVGASMADVSSDAAENFMSALGSFGKQAMPVIQKLGPGVAQGAASGASVGGPWGALIGAGAGLASGLLSSQGKPAAAATPAPRVTPAPTAAPIAPATPATPAMGIPAATPAAPDAPSATPALPTGQAAAGTLLGLFQNPAIQQALLSQVLGASGSQQVSTPSGANVPRGAINSLLMQLLANATESLPESEAVTEQAYLRGADGEYLVDPASLEQHAALVLAHVRQPSSRARPAESWSVIDAFDDAIEFY